MRNVMNLSKKDKLVYSANSDGKAVISKLAICEDGPVLNNFLSFLAKDIENSPQSLVPMTVEKFMQISSLVEDIKIDLETPVDAEDDE
jgi:antitoxin PrlF